MCCRVRRNHFGAHGGFSRVDLWTACSCRKFCTAVILVSFTGLFHVPLLTNMLYPHDAGSFRLCFNLPQCKITYSRHGPACTLHSGDAQSNLPETSDPWRISPRNPACVILRLSTLRLYLFQCDPNISSQFYCVSTTLRARHGEGKVPYLGRAWSLGFFRTGCLCNVAVVGSVYDGPILLLHHRKLQRPAAHARYMRPTPTNSNATGKDEKNTLARRKHTTNQQFFTRIMPLRVYR